MVYNMAITKKGQIVIPKEIREKLKIEPLEKLTIEFSELNNDIRITKKDSIFSRAGKYRPKKIVSTSKLRKKFNDEYEGRY